MDNWVIGAKLFILLYCVVKYISGDMKSGAVVLLLILLYISINMAFYIFKGENLKRLLLLASIMLLIIAAYKVNMLFIFFVPINSGELVSRYTSDLRLTAVPAVILGFIVEKAILPEYILDAAFSLCLFLLVKKAFERIAGLTGEIFSLMEKNDALYKRIDLGTDYENQLRYLSQMEERNSLAQKIHDKVGHALAGGLIQLEAASVIMESDPSKAKEIIGNVINVLKEGMESIRSTLRNIKPAQEQLGVNRLKTILDEFSMNSGIKSSLDYSDISAISHIHWRIITDNTREALTNTLKYSSATHVKVKLEVLNKLVRAEIKDNGTGAVTLKKGLGLRGMEERVENAGGSLIIDGSAGFSIVILLPI